MNIHHLELFHHVAEAGGITPALSKIPYGIRQPALSSQLIQLEKDLGVRLFQRRPFQLTDAGQSLATFAKPFFSGLPKIEQELREKVRLRLRIGAQASILREYLPQALENFTRNQSDLQLELTETTAIEAEGALRNFQLDIALTELTARPGAGLYAEPLVEVEPVLIVPDGHPASSAETLWKDRKNLPSLICFPERETPTRLFRRYLDSKGIDWPTGITINSADVVKTYCARGFGIGLLARIPGAPPPSGFRYLSLSGVGLFAIGALWPLQPTPITEAFLAHLRRYVGKLIQPAV